MAIRDRVTITTRDGQVRSMTVTKQGGTILQTWPKTKTGNYQAEMLDKNSQPSGESVVVPPDNISSVVTDSEPKTAKRVKS